MKFVATKSVEQQGILALHAARSLLVKQQAMLANATRGLATELGLTVLKGIRKFPELMELIAADETIAKQARQAITGLHDRCQELAEGIETFEAEIVAHVRHDETARRLATIPGIGPTPASLIAATVGDMALVQTPVLSTKWNDIGRRIQRAANLQICIEAQFAPEPSPPRCPAIRCETLLPSTARIPTSRSRVRPEPTSTSYPGHMRL